MTLSVAIHRVLRAIAQVVPAGSRPQWRAEWEGECAFLMKRGATAPLLLRRLASALIHAAYLRWETVHMRDLWLDLRFATRTLGRQPLLTMTVALTFALGIGANAAMYSVMRGTVLKPLPLADQDRLVVAWQVNRRGGIGVFSYPDFQDWRTTSTTVDGAAAMNTADGVVVGLGDADRVHLRVVTPSFFTVTGAPVRGRTFTDADTTPGSERVVIVTEKFAARAGGRDLLGTSFQLNGVVRRIVGVMPVDPVAALYPAEAEVIVPLVLQPEVVDGRGNRNFSVLAHLRPGATVDLANRELMALIGNLGAAFPETNAGRGAFVRTLTNELSAGAGRSLWLAGLVTSIVLLVACANIAGLLLARNAERSAEFAVRTALGASRWRIARQLFAESAVLAVIGGAGALVTLAWSSAYLAARLPSTLPRRSDVHVDPFVIAATLGLTLLTAVIAALPASLSASSSRANQFGTYRRAGRLRTVLVAGQLAAAVCLLVCVTLLSTSFVRLLRVDPGFVPDRVVTTQIGIPRGYTEASAPAFVERVIAAVEAKPGVAAAGLFGPVPFSGNVNGWEVSSPGIDLPAPIRADRYTTTENSMALMGVTLVRGRMLGRTDFTTAGRFNVVVDELLSKQMFGDSDPIGRTIRLDTNPLLTIVGVARHIRHYGFDETARPQVYVSYAYDPVSWLNLVVKTRGDDPDAAIRDIRRAVLEVDPAAAPYEAATIRTLIDRTVADRRTASTLAGALAGVTLLIAVAGLYGAMTFSVERRTKEIGVRAALGADRGSIARMVLGEAMAVTLGGLALGLPLAFAGARVIATFLFETSPFDPAIYAAVAIGALAVAALAAFIPARKASAIDPLTALRSE
jgi:putative ABC transport system permease protein